VGETASFETYVRLLKILDVEECRRIIDTFEQDVEGHVPGRVVGGFRPEVKRTTDLRISERAQVAPARWGRTFDHLHETMTEALTRYMAGTPGASWINGPLVDTGYQVQRYDQEVGHYSTHIDADSPATALRLIAVVLYLNDVAEGGETVFPTWGLRFRPRAGYALLFPAAFCHAHGSEIPRSGPKYVVTTFISFDPAAAGLRFRKAER
jgi:hypothetical protein